jgi:zinc transport system permease protein
MTVIITTVIKTRPAMLDDFFTRALVAGIGFAAVAGPLGCFIIWRRMAYFGDTMAHSALLGVALALLLEIDVTLGVFVMSVAVALSLLVLQRLGTLSSDTILGILSHSALALGIVIISLMTWVRVDLKTYLLGDILTVSSLDIAVIYAGGAAALALLAVIWRPLLAATASFDLARSEGMRPERARLVFMLLIAAIIAITMKIMGILLITALLIIPAATARRFCTTPEQMALASAAVGAAAVALGLFGSLQLDTPSGPSIVAAAMLVFLVSLVLSLAMTRAQSSKG